ncbi:MAG TPA: carboxylating nicotinate-nucleotide diphosphorylase [Gammaproteobacteria bacterium]|nr:carboxylating nicotinate-nucleotide diphosphorylase [Gammaproteobacteria bacterium]
MKPDPTTAAGIVGQVRQALTEDIGGGDITAELIPPDAHLGGSVIAREPGVLCGRDWFDEVFRQLDPKLSIRWFAEDGATLHPDQQLCELSGQARSLLTGERTALNFVQLLSAVATRTHTYVNAVAGNNCRILDTRKTLPGLRLAQKYAVRCGGGTNHRIGLFDAILLKENHIIAAGSIAQAVAQARIQNSAVLLEVEVETLDELEQALQAGADRVLLDNFSLDQLRQAVAQTTGRAELEASGGITLQTIAEIAATGVDFISVGELTKSVGALDLSMRLHQP